MLIRLITYRLLFDFTILSNSDTTKLTSFSFLYSFSLGLPFILDNGLGVDWWLDERFGKPELLVTWKFTVAGVVDILSISKVERIVVLVKFISLKGLIVFDTITIHIGDFSTMPSVLGGLDESKILWALNIVDQERESILILGLDVFVITEAVSHLHLGLLLSEILSSELLLAQGSWRLGFLVLILLLLILLLFLLDLLLF